MLSPALAVLSASIAVTLTAFELVVAGHFESTHVEIMGQFYRILAVNIAAIWLLCFCSGHVGSWLHGVVGLTRHRAGIAGVLSPVIPVVLYLGGFSAHSFSVPDWILFVVGTPSSFMAATVLLRGRFPAAVESAILAAWPAVAPIAVWTRYAQCLYQGPGQLKGATFLAAIVWAIGVVGIAVALWHRPRIGGILAVGGSLAVAIAALSSSTSKDLNRHDTLLSPPEPSLGPIILITVDTLRQDALSLHGSGTPTPAIDSLAAESIVFDRAFSTAPWTYVSFSSIHSGLSPWAHGIRSPWNRIEKNVGALAPVMRDHGYLTMSIGSSLLMAPGAPAEPFVLSFSDWLFFPQMSAPHTRAQTLLNAWDPKFLDMTASTDVVGEYAQKWTANHTESPFFLWVHFLDPHSPYDLVADFPPTVEPLEHFRRVAPRSLDILQHRGKRLPGLREWSLALYRSEVQGVDRAIGRFLAKLKDSGVYDRALIIFTSDHGEEFAEHGNYGHGQSLYDELVRVPLIIKLPNGEVSMRTRRPVSTVAIAPTIFDLAEVPYEENQFSASSLRSTWEVRQTSSPAEPVFMTGVNPAEPAEAVVWENFKFIRWENVEHEELYDIESDPGELYNLARSLPDEVLIAKALLAKHAAEESRRAKARGFRAPVKAPLAPDQEQLLRGLGYLQ